MLTTPLLSMSVNVCHVGQWYSLVENHGRALALHFMHYNFCRVHQTLRVTPAMQAGITDHAWSIEEVLVTVLQNREEAA
jgi:hypothetical protein